MERGGHRKEGILARYLSNIFSCNNTELLNLELSFFLISSFKIRKRVYPSFESEFHFNDWVNRRNLIKYIIQTNKKNKTKQKNKKNVKLNDFMLVHFSPSNLYVFEKVDSSLISRYCNFSWWFLEKNMVWKIYTFRKKNWVVSTLYTPGPLRTRELQKF